MKPKPKDRGLIRSAELYQKKLELDKQKEDGVLVGLTDPDRKIPSGEREEN